MCGMKQDRNLVQVVVGLGVLALGLLFTFDNIGLIEAGDYLRYWPLILVGVGLAQIIQAGTWSSYVGAVIWVLAGLWFLGRNVGLIRVGLLDIWPLVLAGVGTLLVFRGWRGYDRRRGRWPGSQGAQGTADTFDIGEDGWVTPVPAPRVPEPREPARRVEPAPIALPPREAPRESPQEEPGPRVRRGENTVNAFVIMGGIGRRFNTQDFKGGTAIAVMGGVELDLRQASIAQGEAAIDVLAFWGGIEIRVPEDWVVESQVFPFMGGFEDRTGPRPSGARKRLVVRGLAFMGGVEVKH